MGRFLAGVASALLIVAAGFVWWRSGAGAHDPVPAAPAAAAGAAIAGPGEPPPQASEATRESKRFGRYDHDRDGIVSKEEWLAARRKAFARLDANGDGKLDFDEWASKTIARFTSADADKSGTLTPAEFAGTKIVRRPQTLRAANCPPSPTVGADSDD